MNALVELWDIITLQFKLPIIRVTDIVEISIIAAMIYQLIKWVRGTRAWMLFKGILVLMFISFIAMIFELKTILWIFANTINVGIIALLIVFQPELRRALEQLGRKNIFASIISFDEQRDKKDRISAESIKALLVSVREMSHTKTGALIVIEQDVKLYEYEKTGIPLDSVISSQMLLNIFEHNTPLHDGAIIIRDNRIVAATCYLPLSDNMSLSKELGTRHRAGVGITEVSDAITIIVSEETGKISMAVNGNLIRNVDNEYLENKLLIVQKRIENVKKFKIWKGRPKDAEKTNK